MILQKIRDMSFRKKCFIASLVVGLIPVILLGSFCYRQMRRSLMDRERTGLRETLNREGAALEEKLSRYLQSAHYICWNNNITQGLGRDYKYVSDMYLFYRDTLDPAISVTRGLNPEISQITAYTEGGLNPHANRLRPLSDVAEEPWLEEVLRDYQDHWYVSGESISIIAQIYDLPPGKTTVVKMDFVYEATFASMQLLYENAYGIFLTDRDGELIYSYATPDMHGASVDLALLQAESLGDGYVTESVPDIGDGWTLWLYRPVDALLRPGEEMLLTIGTVLFLCMLLVVPVSLVLSSGIVRPLEKLTEQMKQVEQGVMVGIDQGSSRDEIGELTRAFNQMVQRLNSLISQLVQEKVLQKEYELRALQAQINPHFLYNSLSLINSRAILADQPEIGRAARFLSVFYRTTLNKGQSITSVRDEMENVRAYVSIQLMMHDNSFRVDYQVQEGMLDKRMPNLLLQPLVENAIIHGVDGIRDGRRGLVELRAEQEGEALVFRVRDNGPGIPSEQLKNLLCPGTEKGYGVKNVHQRVQLLFGPQWGLSYRCAPDQGTEAILRLPWGGEPL